MLILGIETSCDETAAAVVSAGGGPLPAGRHGAFGGEDSHAVLSNIISSQTEFHKKYGGIVPELASRKHIEVISPVIKEALEKAGKSFADISAVAATYGPGLVGSLLVGLCAAKAISYSLEVPLIGVNHLEGHIYANFVGKIQNSKNKIQNFPFVCLLVSGGHTMIVEVKDHGKYKILGRTRDDAAGEAFDKVARFLGLGYPGGPAIDKLAKEGNSDAIRFKLPMMEGHYGYDFSFSGIKTAVINLFSRGKNSKFRTEDICASFQKAVATTLVEKLIKAAKDNNIRMVSLAGGVSANSGLRDYLKKRCAEENMQTKVPSFEYCTDNAAMIGCCAYYKILRGELSSHMLSPQASLKL